MLLHSILRKGSSLYVEYQNMLWAYDKDSYNFFTTGFQYVYQKTNIICKKVKKFIKYAIKHEIYIKALQETKVYKTFAKKEWNTNKNKINQILFDITGQYYDKQMICYIGHPKIPDGCSFMKNKFKFGGYMKECWKNYNIVYFIHETFHTIIDYDFMEDKKVISKLITHSIIELLTDNELRIRLNNEGDYFDVEGHKYLININKKLYPTWIQFVKSKNKNFFDFILQCIAEKEKYLDTVQEKE